MKGHHMATENAGNRRKGGGGRLSRSETVTVRLDPKLRYLTELAARSHRRTTSSFIEWAVDRVVQDMPIMNDRTIGQAADVLWDTNGIDRLVKLGQHAPTLMTHDEQVAWKIVRECNCFWLDSSSGTREPDYEKIRKHWRAVRGLAEGWISVEEFSDSVGEKK
jgi:hypothetical protein